jgi:hypothetical protein
MLQALPLATKERMMQLTCPYCRGVFSASILIATENEAFGAKRSKRLAQKLDEMVLQAISEHPGKFTVSGRPGLWENRSKLCPELRVVGKATMYASTKRLLAGKQIVKGEDNMLRKAS